MSFNQGRVPPYFNNSGYQNTYSPYLYPYATYPTNFNYPSSYNYAHMPSGNYFPFYPSRQLGFYQYPRSYNPFHLNPFSMQAPQYQQRGAEFRTSQYEKNKVKETVDKASTPQVIDLCEQSQERIVEQVQPVKQIIVEIVKQKVQPVEEILPKKRRIKPFKIDENYVNYTNIKFPTRAKEQCTIPLNNKQKDKIPQKISEIKKQVNIFSSIKRKKIIKKANETHYKDKKKSNKSQTESQESIFIPLEIKIGPEYQCQVPQMIYLTSQQWPKFENQKMGQLKNLLIRKFY